MQLRQIARLIPTGILLAMAAACSAVPADQTPKGPAPGMETRRPDRMPGEYILTVAPGTGSKQLSALLAPFKPDRIRDLGHGGLWLVHLRKDPGLESLKRRALKSKSIRAVQPNFRYYKMRSPTQPKLRAPL